VDQIEVKKVEKVHASKLYSLLHSSITHAKKLKYFLKTGNAYFYFKTGKQLFFKPKSTHRVHVKNDSIS
jgi:hypothetical protein